jgi:diguanylate cyclase (GGDEF)-like protein
MDTELYPMRLGRKVLVPSLVAAVLPFALVWLPGAHWSVAPLLAAGVLTILLSAMALGAPGLPAWGPSRLAFAYLVTFALLRYAGGPSGVAPVILLPVFWIGVYGTPRQLALLIAGIALLLLLPAGVVGGPSYPPSTWRAALLFVAVSGLVGWTIQTLVAHVRRQDEKHAALLVQLEGLAHTDPLTRLPNRRAWEAELERALARTHRTGEGFTVALLDLDGLKATNDHHGHAAGDALLAQIARNWRRVLRPDDVLARIGGDEFAVLLPECGETKAAEVIDRLHERTPVPHSFSVGLAEWEEDRSGPELMQRADEALYAAKRERSRRSVAVA